jgi:hypothetical protein
MNTYEQYLIDNSMMIVNGLVTYKLDHIATVNINGRHSFNVMRRYNSPYNIVIEDSNNDLYYHQDYTVRKSLQTIMCLSDIGAMKMYTYNSFSYKHNSTMTTNLLDMKWTDIHTKYVTSIINLVYPQYPVPSPIYSPVSTPMPQTMPQTMPPPIHVPAYSDNVRECDGPTLSMRFSDVKNRLATPKATDDDNNYTVLRNGLKIPKN